MLLFTDRRHITPSHSSLHIIEILLSIFFFLSFSAHAFFAAFPPLSRHIYFSLISPLLDDIATPPILSPAAATPARRHRRRRWRRFITLIITPPPDALFFRHIVY
jgi:hypothetical protein